MSGTTRIMGILNATPDSFSGDGQISTTELVKQAQQQLADGASLLDIGGESSRPASTPVTIAEEIRRVVPAIQALRAASISAPVFVDTWKSAVAEAALDAGATGINDIWGGRRDAHILALAAARRVPVILMDNASDASAVYTTATGTSYAATNEETLSFIPQLAARLNQLAQTARAAGVAHEAITLDPGIGFGKTVAQNTAILAQLPQLASIGYPLLVGYSRKSFIGEITSTPVENRLAGGLACATIAAWHGVTLIRTHDVAATTAAVRMASAFRSSVSGAVAG